MKNKFLGLFLLGFAIQACISKPLLHTDKRTGILDEKNSKAITTNENSLAAKVDGIASRLSLDEKLAQIEGIRSSDLLEEGKLSLAKCRNLIPFGIGHISQFSSSLDMSPEELRDFVRDLQHYLMTETPSKIPAIFHEVILN